MGGLAAWTLKTDSSDIIFKFGSVKTFRSNDEGNCYKENRKFNVLGVGSVFILITS